MQNTFFRKKLFLLSFFAVAFLVFPNSSSAFFNAVPYVENFVSSFSNTYNNYVLEPTTEAIEKTNTAFEKAVKKILPTSHRVGIPASLKANVGTTASTITAPDWFTNYYDHYTSELAEILYRPDPEVVLTPVAPSTVPRVASKVIQTIGNVPAPQVQTISAPGRQGPAGPQGPQGLQGPRGPKGDSSSTDSSSFVQKSLYDNQVDRILNSIENGVGGLAENLAQVISTGTLTVSGNTTMGGNLTITGNITGNVIGTINPSFTLGSVPF